MMKFRSTIIIGTSLNIVLMIAVKGHLTDKILAKGASLQKTENQR